MNKMKLGHRFVEIQKPPKYCMKNRIIKVALFILLQCTSSIVFGQNLSQTVCGTVIDKDSQMPIIGANVIIVGSNPILGASTDVNGIFEIIKVPVGRVNIQVTAIGYELHLLSNIIVESAKDDVCLEVLE